MRRSLYLALMLSIVLPALASAQTSSCDKPPLVAAPPTTITSPIFPFAIEVPAGITATNFKITVAGSQANLTTTVGTPATNGNQCFLATVTVASTPGQTTISTQYTPAGGTEVSSAPFVLSLVSAVPINHPR